MRRYLHTHILRCSCDDVKAVVGGFDVNSLEKSNTCEALFENVQYMWIFCINKPHVVSVVVVVFLFGSTSVSVSDSMLIVVHGAEQKYLLVFPQEH